ncbi:uncharacterized protein DUF3558 [Amycolatopsis sulphurea]|uniref:Uncharacterized protein DUF3558 n=1 Tax=Amycolatopsis sulphurea TaxID=76022 RepID=A0A2A9FA99_9PSEU|nr:DUF3558 domain-containing protein [Amycolatopsis sulphurea]PFG47701.1 uncharacterized protein DUF3558 [Amycolatopsis sulphurea]
MTRRTLTTLLCATAAVSVIAGCSGGSAAAPASTTPASSSAAAALPHSGAPKVEHLLPASVLSGQPCQEALTSDQLKQILGMTPAGKPDSVPGIGPNCKWGNRDTGAGVAIGYDVETHGGLSIIYQNTKPRAQVWRALPPVQGFPAVAHLAIGAEIKDQFCQVSVGITDELSFDASLTISDAKRGKADPCELTARVADMVVTNLRQKAGS